ncbi:MAG: hypothetical protein R6X12_07800 [bacterium]
MPPRLRLDAERSLEISLARLSPRIGCGLMLGGLPGLGGPEPLLNIMENYGYGRLAADKPGRKVVENSSLLKTFHENAFIQKLPIRRNFQQVYGQRDVLLALDEREKRAWFVGDPQNRLVLANYHRDSLALGLKPHGVALVGSMVRLSAVGWQNLAELLDDRFLDAHPEVQRVEVLTVITGVRWRPPCLGIGASFLNFQELEKVSRAAAAVLRGEAGGEIPG